jgi:hypothetical protein
VLQLCGYLDKYSKALIVHADNVGSHQLMMIRKARAQAASPRAAAGAGGAAALCGAARRREGETLNPGADAFRPPLRRVCARTAWC